MAIFAPFETLLKLSRSSLPSKFTMKRPFLIAVYRSYQSCARPSWSNQSARLVLSATFLLRTDTSGAPTAPPTYCTFLCDCDPTDLALPTPFTVRVVPRKSFTCTMFSTIFLLDFLFCLNNWKLFPVSSKYPPLVKGLTSDTPLYKLNSTWGFLLVRRQREGNKGGKRNYIKHSNLASQLICSHTGFWGFGVLGF